MEPAFKQRLLGAAVLVALAVTFLPMLVMEPAPVSGASDVPLRVPKAPDSGVETHELPLLEPARDAGPALPEAAPAAPASAPAAAPGAAAPTATPAEPMFPPPTAGGDYAVSFGSYATQADAARVVGSLQASQLPGYQEPVTRDGRTVHRVRIGPYASRAEAESARLRAAHVRDDVGAKVVVLDADATAPAATPPSRTVATAPRAVVRTDALAPPTPPAPPAPANPEPAPRPSAASVGFAVQLGAFANAAEAERLVARARAAGFSAFVEQVRTDAGTLSRVRIGPVTDRAEADRLRAQAGAKLGVSGIVRPHP